LRTLPDIEKALRESESRLNAIIQGSPIPQFVIGKDHRVIYWNRALEQYSRIRSADIVGTTMQWKAFYDEKRPCLADLLVDEAFSDIPKWYGGKYSKSRLLDEAYEATDFFPALGESGKWLYFTATVIRDSRGEVIGAVETLEDITERKRAEEQLDEAKKQAEIYLELMGHDINNLNQVGIGYLELALQTPGLDEKFRQLLAKPLEAFRDSSRLIANVEKLQLISAKKLASEKIDIGAMLLNIRARCLNIPDRSVTINYAPATGYTVMANALLEDVFSNIVGNAIKHSSGPLTVDIGLDKVIEQNKGYYKVTIADNGPGIPDELKEKLFTRFQRGKTKAGGKGLGLYLVKSLVESFGGRVWVEDRVPGDHEKGSKFVILLPSAES
jgi:signal transduction histidine kinase